MTLWGMRGLLYNLSMPFIILDRDGVINYESKEYIKTPDEWIPIPGSLEAMATLNRLGFRILIATNQSGVGRGYYSIEMLDRIHEKLMQTLATYGGTVEEIFFCPHRPEEGCCCRKPQPGLIDRIQQKYSLILEDTYLIGDSYVDLLVAKRTGCRPVLVLTGNGQTVLDQYPEYATIPHFDNLKTVVEQLFQKS